MAERGTREGQEGIEAILWDLDGTLVRTEHLHEALERRTLEELGVALDPGIVRETLGLPTRVVFERVLGEAGRPELLEPALARRLELAPEMVVSRSLPVRGAEDVLRDIPMRTHRFALVTSSDRVIAEGVLDRFHWRWRFEVIVAYEDAPEPKPAPDPFRVACERLGVDPARALAVEDSPNGIASARAAGCKVAGVIGAFDQPELRGAHYVLSGVGAVRGLLSALSRAGG